MSIDTLNRLVDSTRIDDQLLFRLHRLVAVASAPVIRLCEGRHGITRREWGLIATLAQHGPQRSSDLAALAGLDRARTSRAIAPLQAKGLIERVAAAGDRRQVILHLTPAGRDVFEALCPDVVHINRALTAVLGADDARTFDRCLDRLLDRALQLQATRRVGPKAQRRLGAHRRRLVVEPGH